MSGKSKRVDIKVIVLGPTSAGKTSLLARYLRGEFGTTAAVRDIGLLPAVLRICTPVSPERH